MRAQIRSAIRMPLALFLFAVAVSSPTFAQMALITVNPNNFAPGHNISNATPGAALRSVTFVPNVNPNAPPQQAFAPQYSQVFAEAVMPNCVLDGVGPLPSLPCAPTGNSVLSYISNLASVSFPDFWGAVRPAIGCFDSAQGSCFAASMAPLLRVDFAAPTDSVSVILGNHGASDGDLEAFTALAAFDETGTNIGTCFSGIPPPGQAPCNNTIVVGPDHQGNSWVKVTFSDPSARIRFVVAGASVDTEPVGIVQFNSPVPIQLAGLLAKAPDVSLELKALLAWVYYTAHDIHASCALLSAFVSEVSAQNGKQINQLTVAQLLSIALPVETAIGCH